MFNYIDLFAGAGGLSEGFTALGFHPVAHVEMNKDACLSLKTRACYYYLKENGQENIYRDYLEKKITREDLYNSVPKEVLNTVINRTMKEGEMEDLFSEISRLKKEQSVDKIDLIVGGPPCQAYSLIGRSRTDMSKDPRNTLYKLYIAVLKQYEPKMFVFENVPGLITAGGGIYFDQIKTAMDEVGYKIDIKLLKSENFGVLQRRRRLVIVGWKKGTPYHYPDFDIVKSNSTVRDILSDLPKLQPGQKNNEYATNEYSQYLRDMGIRKDGDVLTWNEARPNIERDREIYRRAISVWNESHSRLKYTDLPEELCTHKNRKGFLDRFKVVASDEPTAQTMMAHISKDGHYFIHPDIEQARSLTVREAARIQSFPDDFYFEGPRTSVFTQIGNAVPPLMAKGIAKKIKEQLEENNE